MAAVTTRPTADKGVAATMVRSNNSAPVYNPMGAVRILGLGVLTDEEKQPRSEREKREL
jgi:hypothetical protein